MKVRKKTIHFLILSLICIMIILSFMFIINTNVNEFLSNYEDNYESLFIKYGYANQALEYSLNTVIIYVVYCVLFIYMIFSKKEKIFESGFLFLIFSVEFGNYTVRLKWLGTSIKAHVSCMATFQQQYWLYIAILSIATWFLFLCISKEQKKEYIKKDRIIIVTTLMLLSTVLLNIYYYILLYNSYVFALICSVHFIIFFIACGVCTKKFVDEKYYIDRLDLMKIIVISIVFIGARIII